MRLDKLLYENRDRVTFSFEFIPSNKGLTRQSLIEKIEPLMELKPLFVDVTTHRNAVDIVETTNGVHGYMHTKNISTLHICQVIRERFNLEVIPHVICGGFTKMETEDVLLDAHFLEFDNIFALRGDKLAHEKAFVPTPEGNETALDLIKQIADLNRGIYLDETVVNKTKTDFCILTAYYPEKHFEAPNLEQGFNYDLDKLVNGASVLVSQMCFDNYELLKYLSRFNDEMKYKVLPGIKVLTSEAQLKSVPRTFNVNIPNDLYNGLRNSKSYGIDFAVEQCKELIRNGVTHLHFFTMNANSVIKVINKL